jgi:hypothetical protein
MGLFGGLVPPVLIAALLDPFGLPASKQRDM